MRKFYDPIRNIISDAVFQILPPETSETLSREQIYDQLVDPPQPELGDFAFGCFQLSKVLKKAPAHIATELAQTLPEQEYIEKVTAAGPYLNFKMSLRCKGEKVLGEIQNGNFFLTQLTEKNPKTMIEFSQPNTHKELHVGHMRNACLGDSLVRTLRYAGVDVISSTFPGDVGTHVAKCLWYLKFHNQDPVPETGKGEWLGQIYSKANLRLEDDEKSAAHSGQHDLNRSQLTEILKQLEAKKGDYYELWKQTREWSIALMNEAYQWAGIQFDQWYWESEVDSASTQYVKQLYAQGKLTESQGALGMDLSSDNLGFCLLLKSDGTGLYATKDLELARRKFQDFNIEKSIYVVDSRQALHFQQVFKVLERIGFPQAQNCMHLQYNFVELPDGAMSSRKGNIVPLLKLVRNMEHMVKEKYLAKYKAEWSAEEIEHCARQVAQGAIKYGMVKIDANKKIVFDLEEWLKIDGDSGPFIQYSAARIKSLCRKLSPETSPVEMKVQWQLLQHPSEEVLLQGILHFHAVVVNAAENYKPSVICTYLYDLAKRFNHFYHECSIGQADSEELKIARLVLAFCAGEVLKKGLALLGIPTPERM